jgi:ATP-dependent RNA helicase DDX42
MGWFEESDESDDDNEKVKADILDGNSLGVKQNKINNNGDCDEDPLDAYMKSLESSHIPNSSEARPDIDSRLDLLNEEEEEDDTRANVNSNRNYNYERDGMTEIDNNNRDKGSYKQQFYRNSDQSVVARDALNSTFRKAGSEYQGKQTNEFNGIQVNSASKTNLTVSSNDEELYESFDKTFWVMSYSDDGKQWRNDNHVRCVVLLQNNTIDNTKDLDNVKIPDPIYEFPELRDVVGNDLLSTILKNYSKPTIVQSQTLPFSLAGCDSIVTAPTGQGKTLAYLWPIIVHLMNQPPVRNMSSETGPIALILVPTRELALQVQKQANLFLKATHRTNPDWNDKRSISCRAVIGGIGKFVLRQDLKKSGGVDLVIATPGRLLDVLSDRKGLSLRRVTYVVLDEADKMLQMGFESDVRQILSSTRRDRQTIMISATMSRRVERVATEWLLPNAMRISIGRTGEASQNVDQHVIVLPDYNAKIEFLFEIIPTLAQIGRIIIFVATKETCGSLYTVLRNKFGTSSSADVRFETLHGDKHQNDRNAAVRSFTKGDVNVLIATDVAGRGLDIPNVQTVISFDPAKNLDTHVHRVGRAGRLSKDINKEQCQVVGTAYTLLSPKNADFANVLVQAFTKEDREVSSSLQELANHARQMGKFNSKHALVSSGDKHQTSPKRIKWN